MVRQHYGGPDRIPVVYVTIPPRESPRKLALEFARFLGLPSAKNAWNIAGISEAVRQILIEACCDLVQVDEIRNLNLATSAGEDMSDHLKYLTGHLPATYVYAGISVERSRVLTGVGGKQIVGRVRAGRRPVPVPAGMNLHDGRHGGHAAAAPPPARHPARTGPAHQRDDWQLAPSDPAGAITASLGGSEALTRHLLDTILVDHAAQSSREALRDTMTRVASLPPAALPRPVKPFPGEIFASYLARLAHANRLDPETLRRYITAGSRRGPVPVDRLSVVTGLPGITLRYAIPDLDAGPVQPAGYVNGVLVLPGLKARRAAPACSHAGSRYRCGAGSRPRR
jgi:TniQ